MLVLQCKKYHTFQSDEIKKEKKEEKEKERVDGEEIAKEEGENAGMKVERLGDPGLKMDQYSKQLNMKVSSFFLFAVKRATEFKIAPVHLDENFRSV